MTRKLVWLYQTFPVCHSLDDAGTTVLRQRVHDLFCCGRKRGKRMSLGAYHGIISCAALRPSAIGQCSHVLCSVAHVPCKTLCLCRQRPGTRDNRPANTGLMSVPRCKRVLGTQPKRCIRPGTMFMKGLLLSLTHFQR